MNHLDIKKGWIFAMSSNESNFSFTSNKDIVKYLNVRKDPVDLRDKIFRSYLFSNEADLPTQVDLRPKMSGISKPMEYRFLYGECNCFRVKRIPIITIRSSIYLLISFVFILS